MLIVFMSPVRYMFGRGLSESIAYALASPSQPFLAAPAG